MDLAERVRTVLKHPEKLRSLPKGPEVLKAATEEIRALDPEFLSAELRGRAEAIISHVLSAASGVPPLDDDATEQQLESVIEQDRYLGFLFASKFLEDLPATLCDPAEYFVEPDYLGPQERDAIRHFPCVEVGGKIAASFAEFGITPRTIAEASAASGRLIRRQTRRLRQSLEEGVPIAGNTSEIGLSYADFRVSFSRNLAMPTDNASRFLDWFLRVSQYKPFLFQGFEVSLDVNSRRLIATPSSDPIAGVSVLWQPARAPEHTHELRPDAGEGHTRRR